MARLSAGLAGLMLGGVSAVVLAAPASAATGPKLGGVVSSLLGGGSSYGNSGHGGGNYGGSGGGGSYGWSGGGNYGGGSGYGSGNSGNCGTLQILASLGLDMSFGKHMSMYDMPDKGSLDEVTAEVDVNGDGRVDKKIKVGKNRLQGKRMHDGIWGGQSVVNGKKKFWLASSSKSITIVKSYATICGGITMRILMNCICGYGVIGGGGNHGGKPNPRPTVTPTPGDDDCKGQWRDGKWRPGKCDNNGNHGNNGCDHRNNGNNDCDNGNNGNENYSGGNNDGDDDGNNGGGDNDVTLPVTGGALGGVVGAGVMLASAGGLAIVITRRRRQALLTDLA
ncbi:hypothetical protein GCM10010201_25650 [Pilimelia columellifera subsp. columellifera]|uniref:Uncharacterized protein n=1 Tax=Pilimelia columellifera subsp. columellifera TaxID=706583 RepID=A0ABP6AWJ6_9ACTN